jgi:predicted DsbA family dithiol-disulfide isomerase
VVSEFSGVVRPVRRTFILVPPGGGREVFDDYVLKHRAMAARHLPQARFDMPAPGAPYPASSLPALLAQKGVDLHRPERGDAFEMALFEAFFGRSEDVSDPEVLSRLATRAGLDPGEVRSYLQDAEVERQVYADHREAVEELKISGIPTVVVPGLAPIVGAVPADFYREAFRAALEGRRFRPPGGPRLPTV